MTNFAKYPDHPYVAMFPVMTGQPFDNLLEDIKQHGQKVPCKRYKGKILDGRNRIKACAILKIKPILVEWRPSDKDRDVETQILEFIVSMNLHRRQLSESQRALIAAEYYEKTKAPNGINTGQGETLVAASKRFEVSRAYIQSAARLMRDGPPKLIGQVKEGKKALWSAIYDISDVGEQTRIEKQVSRDRILMMFRRMLKKYGRSFREFDDVWAVMRKRLEKIALAE